MASNGDPLSWSDLHAFAIMTMIDLEPGEAEALHRASRAYAAALHEFNGNARPAPFGSQPEQRNKVEDALRMAFRQLTTKGRG